MYTQFFNGKRLWKKPQKPAAGKGVTHRLMRQIFDSALPFNAKELTSH